MSLQLRNFFSRSQYLLSLTLAFMAVSAAAMGYMQYLTPYQMDDLWYLHDFTDMMKEAPEQSVMQNNWEFIKMHYLCINGRIGDKSLIIVLTLVPKWLIGMMCALACFSITFFGCKTAFGSIRRHPVRSIILTALLTLLMPWGDAIFVTNMLINYGIGTGLAAPVVWLFIRPVKLSRHKRLLTAGIFLLALIAGGWHEAFGVPAVGAMAITLLIFRKEARRVQYLLFFGTLAGVIFTLTAPGFWVRVHGTILGNHEFGFLNNLLKGGNLNLLLPVVGVLCLGVKKWRERLGLQVRQLVLMASAMSLCALLVFLFSLSFKRVFWYAEMTTLITFTAIFTPLLKNCQAWVKQLAALALMLITCLHFAFTIPRYRRLVQEFYEIVELYRNSPEGDVFYDYHGRGFGPTLTLWRSRMHSFTYETRGYLKIFFHNSDDKMLQLTPESFRNFSPTRFTRQPQILKHNGYFVTNDTTLRGEEIVYAQCVTEDGDIICIPTLVNFFRASDGTLLYYLEPDERQSGGARLRSLSYEVP